MNPYCKIIVISCYGRSCDVWLFGCPFFSFSVEMNLIAAEESSAIDLYIDIESLK